MRKGQTIKLKLIWSGKDENYSAIVFNNHPDFSFNLTNLKGQKEVEITCINDAGTNINGIQLLVKGDNKDILGAINVFYPKPKIAHIKWVFVEIFGDDKFFLRDETPKIEASKILKSLEHSLNPALIDVTMVNKIAEVVDIQNKKKNLLKHNFFAKTSDILEVQNVKYHAIYLPKEKTVRAQNRNIKTFLF
ncbi:hypothetical protein A8C32_02530 [Flavivirga aquatica]|uniref:Uncharacterized protein n=1 Tax=Flavivirga aquatica TaxID=1849968 RepID=A0A1E5TAL9_9FLAO|nr:hypothetical protein [Flavivirga aquatica]OEK08347.1 hypothetical protein A8C32_02530 [Flavivirga aquatica]